MSNIRKEKEKEFFIEHMEKFKSAGLSDPFFTIKTAFFKKGKYGRQVQFFEWELQKGVDIYVEFYDNVYDDKGAITNVVPMNDDRALFKFTYNPYFAEEYEVKESTNSQGGTYSSYIIPVSELTAILKDGSEITYGLYEKRKKNESKDAVKPQKSLTIFPDFEDKKAETKAESEVKLKTEDVPWYNNDIEKYLDTIGKQLTKIANILEKENK